MFCLCFLNLQSKTKEYIISHSLSAGLLSRLLGWGLLLWGGLLGNLLGDLLGDLLGGDLLGSLGGGLDGFLWSSSGYKIGRIRLAICLIN